MQTRESQLLPIAKIAQKLGLQDSDYETYGKLIAKLDLNTCQKLIEDKEKPQGKLILVTAMSPTPAGEGKTTTSIGLADALNLLGKKSILCLREPSLGPCFGIKGGATGGGMSQVMPMEKINLHFTGDFHAITSAHNLLTALIDNHLHQGNALNIDSRQIEWGRVLDMNDRALREVIVGLGGFNGGVPRSSSFQITVASEVMASFCLAKDLMDLKRRLGKIIIGKNLQGKAIYASDLKAHGAMTALLKDAFRPNLVQTLGHTPAFIHGGPFANIAHGTNSMMATQTALKLADFVVTEAGFGSDLGAEKFINIVCPKASIKPSVGVIVATIRSLKLHGGANKDQLKEANSKALSLGLANLRRHVQNIKNFGLPTIVALNHFYTDLDDEIKIVQEDCLKQGVQVVLSKVWEQGGNGALELAQQIVNLADAKKETCIRPTYDLNDTLQNKVEAIAKKVYAAKGISLSKAASLKLKKIQKEFGHFPVCMAKNPYSFTSDPTLLGAQENFLLEITDFKVQNGAEFVIAYCGDIMTMPGLPLRPSAESIDIDSDGNIHGLF